MIATRVSEVSVEIRGGGTLLVSGWSRGRPWLMSRGRRKIVNVKESQRRIIG